MMKRQQHLAAALSHSRLPHPFENGFQSIATKFQNHSDQTKSQQVVCGLIAEVEVVFGNVWSLMMDVCSAVNTCEGLKRDTDKKRRLQHRKHNIFFAFDKLCKACRQTQYFVLDFGL